MQHKSLLRKYSDTVEGYLTYQNIRKIRKVRKPKSLLRDIHIILLDIIIILLDILYNEISILYRLISLLYSMIQISIKNIVQDLQINPFLKEIILTNKWASHRMIMILPLQSLTITLVLCSSIFDWIIDLNTLYDFWYNATQSPWLLSRSIEYYLKILLKSIQPSWKK